MKDLSIVVLTYNSSVHIKNCLQSITTLYKKELKSGQIGVLVADNASSDNTGQVVREFIKDEKSNSVRLIQNGHNYGFGQGLNSATDKESAKFYLFLNPDAEVVSRTLVDMVEYMKKNAEVKIAGGQIRDYNGEKELSAGKFLTIPRLIGWMLSLENVLKFRYSPSKIQNVDFVSGGCMMVEAEFFKKIGGFDKDYFMYVEDMDLCFRAKKRGFNTGFFPDFKIKHKGQGSSSSSFAYINIFKGIYTFHKKHSSKPSLFLVQLILIIKCVMGIIIGSLVINKSLVNTYREAINFSK